MALRLSTALVNEIMKPSGSSFADVFADGILIIYSGTQPTNADSAESGTELVQITVGGGTFVSGSATYGLNFGAATDGTIGIPAATTWKGTAGNTGQAGWARFYPNDLTGNLGSGTDKIRFDVAAVSEMVMLNYTITSGGDSTVNSLSVTQPKA